MSTIAELLRARAADRGVGLLFEDEAYRYDELISAAAARAAFLLERSRPGPLHVGVLLDNVPEYLHWLSGAALAGGVVVGINPTRRGAELARDIAHTDCQWVVTDEEHLPLLDGLDLGVPADRVVVVDRADHRAELAGHAGTGLPAVTPGADDLYLLLFTSGSSGTPKACRCTQGRLARIGAYMTQRSILGADDVCYEAMPLFHSNALMAGWAPTLAAGATVALRRRFSASSWLPDVRRFGATFFNYVGKPLAYILSTPERPDDADNPLRLAYGNEANPLDVQRFAARFGCRIVDSYGSTEGVVSIPPTPDTPAGALGPAPEGTAVLDPATERACPPARFDASGRLANPEEAVGEIVARVDASSFEGYYNEPEAEVAQVREGRYWTGDLAYTDEQGFVYFAGRGHDRLRVDGENFGAAPIEAILTRHPDVTLAAVYAVPDPRVGDQVMACLQLRPGAHFDPEALDRHLRSQPDLGTKWSPRFVRVTAAMPVTASNKIIKRRLRAERWECADPVWWRPEAGAALRRLQDDDLPRIREAFAAAGHLAALDAI